MLPAAPWMMPDPSDRALADLSLIPLAILV
jgi:hypothetical protein